MHVNLCDDIALYMQLGFVKNVSADAIVVVHAMSSADTIVAFS